HALETADHVTNGVVAHVAHVKSALGYGNIDRQ
ncbi:hypothetical protein MGSAQ_002502, partial [marine sediment metagenome]